MATYSNVSHDNIPHFVKLDTEGCRVKTEGSFSGLHLIYSTWKKVEKRVSRGEREGEMLEQAQTLKCPCPLIFPSFPPAVDFPLPLLSIPLVHAVPRQPGTNVLFISLHR